MSFDLGEVKTFSTEPKAKLKVQHPGDEAQYFTATIKSRRHPKIKKEYDDAVNKLVKLQTTASKRKTPEYIQAMDQASRKIVHMVMDEDWDVELNGHPIENNSANRNKLMSLIPGIDEVIKDLAEDDTNFFKDQKTTTTEDTETEV